MINDFCILLLNENNISHVMKCVIYSHLHFSSAWLNDSVTQYSLRYQCVVTQYFDIEKHACGITDRFSPRISSSYPIKQHGVVKWYHYTILWSVMNIITRSLHGSIALSQGLSFVMTKLHANKHYRTKQVTGIHHNAEWIKIKHLGGDYS